MKTCRIIFLCHGNICRSPMAEWLFKYLAAEAGAGEHFEVSSAAVSYEEEGNGMYPPARRKLSQKGIPFGSHCAHRITPEEYEAADLVIIMDRSNRRMLEYIVGDDREGKVHSMLEYAGLNRDVADPWYTGDFEKAYNDILMGCRGLLETLSAKND